MSHSFSKIWIHMVTGTKFRKQLIAENHEIKIYNHIKSELQKIECEVKIINGMPDHIHVLYKQSPKLAIVDVIKKIKGNSSNWINSEDILKFKFAWQTGYGAFSVSESQLSRVFSYIKNQKEHHKKQSFKEEYEELLQMHEFDLTNIWDEE